MTAGGRDRRKANGASFPMLRRLRVKFVALSMTVVTLALVMALFAIGYLDYRQSVDDVYGELRQTLSVAASMDAGRHGDYPFGGSALIPDRRGPFGGKAPDDAGWDDAPSAGEAPAEGGDQGEAPQPPEIGRGDGQGLMPVAVYRIDPSGTVAAVGRLATASVAPELLPDVLDAVLTGEESQGYLPDPGLFYAKRRTVDGTLVAFADQGAASSWQSLALTLVLTGEESQGYLPDPGLFYAKRRTVDGTLVAFADQGAASSWQSLALTLTGVGAGALLAFLAVSILFARWALRPVERAWSQQQRFVADASHELKTPLTVILANLAIVRGRPGETVASQEQWLAGTETEARRMQGLVGDLLDLARMPDPAALRAGFAPVDLTDLVEGEALQFDSVALDRGVAIECDLAPALRVEGDAARLERLVGVLVDNACKYAEEGSTVEVRLAAEGREAVLAVTNRGPLIAPKDLAHVFDRFFRVDAARTRADAPDGGQPAAGGWGLGLAIAREIARDHGGAIAAASIPEPGTGAARTTFTVRLPRA